jgi:MFS family permease
VQTAISLPAVLLALLVGAAADILDRRRLVLATQVGMVAATATLTVLALAGAISAPAVLALTFVLGAGMATTILAYQAMTPDAAGRALLAPAVALNGVAINIARAVGPALAGLLVAALSAGALFAIETALLLAIMLLVFRLALPGERPAGRRERLVGAMRTGARFVRHSQPVRVVLVRAALFSLCGSALWALLPVVALGPLDVGSRGFGLLLGCVGAGAITAAVLLPPVRRRVSLDSLVAIGTVQLALGLLVLAYVREPLVVAPLLLPTGAAWLTVMSSLNTYAQRVAPAWVRGRTLASFQLFFQGGLALGSFGWGLLAGAGDVRTALVIAAAGLAAGAVLGSLRWRLWAHDADLSPAPAWSEPALPIEPDPTDGPVLVTVEYRIEEQNAARFSELMGELERVRRRDGAYDWRLYSDLGAPGWYLEAFMLDSWEEHMRQHGRMTVGDLDVRAAVRALHVGEEEPAVRHLLATPRRRRLGPTSR